MYTFELAKEIKNHHVYLTASINEPGGNHQNEGALCGLPLLYRDSGCLPEYCNGYGVMFNEDNFEKSLEQIKVKYETYAQKMNKYPHNAEFTSLQYINLFKKLYYDNSSTHDNKRFYKQPIKTIKSFFVI